MNDHNKQMTLEDYLDLEYSLRVHADPDGGYVIEFPDLPGCMTQIESLDELPEMANDIRSLWIETEFDHSGDIPMPSYPVEYSGKFNLRLPKSLHQRLAESAEADGVSLNQYVVTLLSERDALARIERRIDELSAQPNTRELVEAGD